MPAFTVNGQAVQVDAEPDTPLLWVLRDYLNLTGTKFGCGVSACGACTVHLDGNALRSCVIPVSACEGKHVTTIEGLKQDGSLHPYSRRGSTIRSRNAATARRDDHGGGGAAQRQPQPDATRTSPRRSPTSADAAPTGA